MREKIIFLVGPTALLGLLGITKPKEMQGNTLFKRGA